MRDMTITGLDRVQAALRTYADDTISKAEAEMRNIALDAQQTAKQNRPWQDRTGNARRSIIGSMSSNRRVITAALAIGVSYGKYLELAHGGRYRIVEPTMLGGNRNTFLTRIKRAVQS